MNTNDNKPEGLHDVEITKEQFKAYYFKYATPDSGWTKDYWNKFYEKEEEGARYFFMGPPEEGERMCTTDGMKKHRMYFLTEDAIDAFYDFPGKDE